MLEDVTQLGPQGLAAETSQPLGHVGGVARLAHLAVADDVDAGRLLALDHFAHRAAHAVGEHALIDLAPFLFGEHQLDQLLGPGEAAGVRGQDAIDAAFHELLLAAQYVARPPLASMHCAVMKLAASDARKCTTAATSSAVPNRPIGALLSITCVDSGGS